MGTRGVIVVRGKAERGTSQACHVYLAGDGYPTGVLDAVCEAFKAAQTVMDASNKRWKEKLKINPSLLSGKLIGALASEHGMRAFLEDTNDDEHGADLFGKGDGYPTDLEWIYAINTEEKTLDIYGGGYADCLPLQHVKKGTVDPYTYVTKLREECQDDERKETAKQLADLKAIGVKVNGGGGKVAAFKVKARPKAKAVRAKRKA